MSNEENKPKVDDQEMKEESSTKNEAEFGKAADGEDKKEDTSVDEKDGDKKSADDATDGDADGDTEEEEVKKPAKKRPVKTDDAKNDDDDEEKETEEDGEDEDEGGTTEDEKKNGLAAKKAKKSDEKKEKKEEVDIPDGKGTAFQDCPRIEHFIAQREASQLKKLHAVLFGKVGKVDKIKGNLLQFNGFDYEPESDAYTQKKQTIAKLDFKHLKDICDVLDIEKKGKKDDIVTRVMDFLMDPKDSGKAVPAVPPPRPKRTSAVKANNRGYAGLDSEDDDEGGRRGRAGRRAKARPSYKDETSSEDEKPKRGGKFSDSAEDSDPEVSPEASDSDSDSHKKKKKVTPAKGRGRGAPKKTPVAAKKPKRAVAKRGKRKASDSDEKSESEDEPLQKKSKKFPGDEEIKKIVKQILDGANLEEITMKTVCKQVYSKYPDHDLTHKKDLIKTTVKSLIAT